MRHFPQRPTMLASVRRLTITAVKRPVENGIGPHGQKLRYPKNGEIVRWIHL